MGTLLSHVDCPIGPDIDLAYFPAVGVQGAEEHHWILWVPVMPSTR